ncbi:MULTISPECIES: metalloregulator ArsR/SmtB family transcription factor [unclassified Janthinobacterium]|uniref:helix-turn-helix transcriptional regulator n=1 Tax=unclassified Janthinobacterium TaxID=2610881 RepID=UPI001612D142|nr:MULTISPECIES: metalloregulator ArsR/SmtB family transcription factor [unclassified Janthinobacterium]MBB5610282.1 putative ArsR family transcriptional regulator [Janthinobacterium sp. S3T4]MBB5615699.1 putative ArsR family transcriptional regulator [Janthinobacterium sp. S3M3]
MNTFEQTLFLLKMRGPQTAQQLAALLDITSMGARRQLEAAQEKGLLVCEDVADKVGRPSRRWQLSEAGHARFPDRHADLTLELIAQVKTLFGEAGLDKLIAAREQSSEAAYRKLIDGDSTLLQRVNSLAVARDGEGYMANAEVQDDGSVLLVENHCPICAAATSCQNFCRSELAIFQRVLGEGCTVERSEHLLDGGRRCVYKIVPVGS